MGYFKFLVQQLLATLKLRFRGPSVRVKTSGLAGLVYFEGRRSLHVSSEMLLGSSDLAVAIDLSSVSAWDPPFDHERLSEADLDRIRENLSLAFVGYRIEWSDSRLEQTCPGMT